MASAVSAHERRHQHLGRLALPVRQRRYSSTRLAGDALRPVRQHSRVGGVRPWAVSQGIALDLEEVLVPEHVDRWADFRRATHPRAAHVYRAQLRRMGWTLKQRAPRPPTPPALAKTW